MRRLSVIVMCIIMVFAVCDVNKINASNEVKAETKDTDIERFPSKIYLEKNADGLYEMSLKKTGEVAKRVLDEGVYELKNGSNVLSTGTGIYQSVDIVEVMLSDLDAIENVIQQYNIDAHIANDLRENANKVNDSSSKITLVLPALSLTRGTSTSYYTYKGHAMKNTLVYYFNLSFGKQTIESGNYAKSFADGTTTFLLTGAGFASTPIAIAAAGLSILGWWTSNISATTFHPSYGDRIQMDINYNVWNKYTYADVGSGYQLGARTQYIKVKSVEVDQYWVDSSWGHSEEYVYTLNKNVYSPNYWNPEHVALSSTSNPLVESFRTTIGDYTFVY